MAFAVFCASGPAHRVCGLVVRKGGRNERQKAELRIAARSHAGALHFWVEKGHAGDHGLDVYLRYSQA